MHLLSLPVPRVSFSVSLALVAAGALLLASVSGCSVAVAPEEVQPETPQGADAPDTGDPPEPDRATVSVAPATATEGEHAAFAVTVSGTLRTRATVHWKTEDGTAKGGADFMAVSGGTVVLGIGATRETIMVATFEDDAHEDDETFAVALTGVSPPGAASLARAAATGTITDAPPSSIAPPPDGGAPPGGGTPPNGGAPPDDHGDTRETASVVAPGTPVSGQLETGADVDFFKVSVPGERLMYAATDAGRVGDPGYGAETAVRIETADAISTNTDAFDGEYVSAGMAYVRVSGASATGYDLAVWLLERTESDTSFDIELRYLGTQPTTAQKEVFRTAADVWEDVITGDLARGVIYDSRFECEDGGSVRLRRHR